MKEQNIVAKIDPNNPVLRFYSQWNEDRFVYETVFKSRINSIQDGFFVEIGALDGISISNTMFYEKSLGWRGILYEPDPDSFGGMLKVDRPNSIKVNMAGCAKDEIVKFEMAHETAVSGIKDVISPQIRNHPIFVLKKIADVWCGRLDRSF